MIESKRIGQIWEYNAIDGSSKEVEITSINPKDGTIVFTVLKTREVWFSSPNHNAFVRILEKVEK